MDVAATRPAVTRQDQPRRGRGLILSGRYRLDEQIAVGGMGDVWSATDLVLDRRVAVKLLRADVGDDRTLLRRFRVEARHAAALTHPGVARVYDYGEDVSAGSTAYLVMELVDGQPVSATARRGPMPAAAVVGLLTQAADALGAAHVVGLVHRDVKPGNLLVSSNGVLKITDFGIAHAIGSAAMTDDGRVVGTARYMSPEQAMGGQVAPSSDVYSLAVVGYQLLAGRTPFDGAPAAVALQHVRSLPPPLPVNVPRDLRVLIERSLDKDPTKRPANGDVMATELRALTDASAADVAPSGRPTAAEPTQAADPSTRTVLDATQVWAAKGQAAPTPVAHPATLVDPVRLRRWRRWRIAGVVALCAVSLGLLAGRAASTSEPIGDVSVPSVQSTIAATTPAEAVPPTSTIVVTPSTSPAPVTTAATSGNGKGKDKAKDKGKGHG